MTPRLIELISDTQLQILQLSEFLLGTLGATGLELKSIATKLEVSPSLINHYYKSSEELIFDTVIYSYSRHIYGIQEKNKYESDPELVARSWIKETMAWTQSYPGIGVILEFPRQVLRSGSKRAEDPCHHMESATLPLWHLLYVPSRRRRNSKSLRRPRLQL
jgi:AcrR family transcriptional regulator